MKEYKVYYQEVESTVLYNARKDTYYSEEKVDTFIAKNEEQAMLHINKNYVGTNRHITQITSKTISAKTLSKFSTEDLIEELSKRKGVQDVFVQHEYKRGKEISKINVEGRPRRVLAIK